MRQVLVTAVACVAFLSGCAGPRPMKLPGDLAALPYRVEPVVSSAISDPYMVMTGPAKTYRSHRFNERFNATLERYAAAVSGGSEPVTLRIDLKSLQTAYDEVGATDEGPYPFAGSQTILGPVRLMSLDSFDGDHGDMNIPLEIIKTATLTGTMEILHGDRTLKSAEIQETRTVTVHYLDYSAWAYDYSDVFDAVIRATIETVDHALRDALSQVE